MNLFGLRLIEYAHNSGQPTLGTTMECTQIPVTQHEAFMRAVQKELAKFERQEIEFRNRDREERAIELHIPLAAIEH
jgi:hypothetical protein